jgi:hypothetical protein
MKCILICLEKIYTYIKKGDSKQYEHFVAKSCVCVVQVFVPRFGTCIISAHLLKVNTYIYMHLGTLYCNSFVFNVNVKNINSL